MAELYYSDIMSEAERNMNGIPLMEDSDRKKIQFIAINASGRAEYEIDSLIAEAQVNGKRIPVIQDRENFLIKGISNNDANHKDDMALFDRNGRLIKYFESYTAYLGMQPNSITKAVASTLAGHYDGKCGASPRDETIVDETINDDIIVGESPKDVGDDNPKEVEDETPKGVEDETLKGVENEKPKEVGCVRAFYKYGGEMVSAGKANGVCDCHDICLVTGHAGYVFRVPKNRMGKCHCLKNVVPSTKVNNKWMSGEF